MRGSIHACLGLTLFGASTTASAVMFNRRTVADGVGCLRPGGFRRIGPADAVAVGRLEG